MNPITQRRCEALVVMLACIGVYYANAYDMGRFAIWFFLPDIAIFAYFLGKDVGGRCYNLTHFFAWPILVAGLAYFQQNDLLYQVALIWAAHIAFDRALGWGLKLSDSFYNTDMGYREMGFKPSFLE